MSALRRVALPLVAIIAATSPAHAVDFYQNKQITITVGFTAGGLYDVSARLWARFLTKHLAGHPTVVVRNLPGSGSLVAALHTYTTAPKDGTTLAVIGGGTVIEPLLGNPQATYDARRFNWIGGKSRDNSLCVVWHTVPVKTIGDVMTRETVVGSTGPGSRTLSYPKALNELVGTKFKVVTGYPGGNEISLAMERGEVEGYCGWAIGAIMARVPQWLTGGLIRPLAQFTLAKPDFPNVPLASDLPKTQAGRQAIDFLTSDSVLAWPLVAPPDLPTERVNELRAAYNAMMKDPELIAEATKMSLEIDPVSGVDMQDLVRRLYETPAEVIELVKRVNAAR
jgi:tripartite-type tricarboxylate transporter receptor subunit TctC